MAQNDHKMSRYRHKKFWTIRPCMSIILHIAQSVSYFLSIEQSAMSRKDSRSMNQSAMLPKDVGSEINNPFLIRMCRVRGKHVPFTVSHSKDIVIQFIVHGAGLFISNNNKYRFKRNSVLISVPDKVQCCVPDRGPLFERICIAFPHDLCLSVFPRQVCDGMPPVLNLRMQDAGRVERLLKDISFEFRLKTGYWRDTIVRQIQLMLIVLYRCHHYRARIFSSHPVSMQIMQYIEECYRTNVTRQDIARKYHMSVRHLTRLFQNEVGMGLQQYIIQRKIAEAKLLLKSSKAKIVSISEAIGMRRVRMFNHDFRRETGMTPSRYRKMMHKWK